MSIYLEADDELPDLPPEELIRQRKSLDTDDLCRLMERLKFDRLRIRFALEEAEGRDDETTKAWRRRARFAFEAKGLGIYYIQNELVRRSRLLRKAMPDATFAQAFMQEAQKQLGSQLYRRLADQASRKVTRTAPEPAVKLTLGATGR
jgi:hypothetical protein